MRQLVQQVIEHKRNHLVPVGPEMLVAEAVARMSMRHVGSLLVVDEGRLVGIVTKRDLLARVLATRRDPKATSMRQVMTREVVVISPKDTVADAMATATRSRCAQLPVVDDDRICGVVSATELAAWLVREQEQTIADLHSYITR